MENVKAIINSNHFDTFQSWRQELIKLGYETKTYCLNAACFNSCQNRERIFELSVLKTHKKKTGFTFPEFNNNHNKVPLKSILDKDVEFNQKWNKYELFDLTKTKNNIHKLELKNYTNFSSEKFVYDINYSGPTLTATGALSRIKLFYRENYIREMLPNECFKYMGFKKSDYEKVRKTKLISDQKMIFLCGNSISVQVLETIFESLRF